MTEMEKRELESLKLVLDALLELPAESRDRVLRCAGAYLEVSGAGR